MVVLDCKTSAAGKILKFKARAVLVGSKSKHRYSELEKYSPVLSIDAMNLLIAHGVQKDMEFTVADVTQAFTNSPVEGSGILPDDVYVRAGDYPGYELKDPNHDCYILHFLSYGHCLASSAWYNLINQHLEDLGGTVSEVDPCLFKFEGWQEEVYMGLFVDDCTFVHKKDSRLLSIILKKLMSLIVFGKVMSTDMPNVSKVINEVSQSEDDKGRHASLSVTALDQVLGVEFHKLEHSVRLTQSVKIANIYKDYEYIFASDAQFADMKIDVLLINAEYENFFAKTTKLSFLDRFRHLCP